MSDPEVECPAALGRPQERAGEIVVRLGYLHVRAVANHRDDAAELTGLTTGAITGRVDRLEATGFARRTATARPRRVVVELNGTKMGDAEPVVGEIVADNDRPPGIPPVGPNSPTGYRRRVRFDVLIT